MNIGDIVSFNFDGTNCKKGEIVQFSEDGTRAIVKTENRFYIIFTNRLNMEE